MKTITKYVANDGSEHTATDACLKRDVLCAAVDSVMSLIPPRFDDKGCNYSNGHGYWQHDADRAATVRHGLLTLAKEHIPHRWIDESLADPSVDSSWAGRIISEGPEPIYTAWCRIQCMDKQWREWGQTYYANNPDSAETVCLNPQ
jgi:hypothetical protein